jgi:hypothetical protein
MRPGTRMTRNEKFAIDNKGGDYCGTGNNPIIDSKSYPVICRLVFYHFEFILHKKTYPF